MSVEMQSQVLTIESGVYVDEAMSRCLRDIAISYSFLERTLFNDIVNVEKSDRDLWKVTKHKYIEEHKITARQFNALWSEVMAKISALKEVHNEDIKRVNKQINKAKKQIVKHKKIVKEGSKRFKKSKGKNRVMLCKYTTHEVKRSKQVLSQLRKKLNRLEYEKTQVYKPSIVFGTRDYFKKQWMDDKYKEDHAAWRDEWQRKRNGHFYCLGSKDETNGNQSCQYVVDGDKEYLQLRLPDSLVEKYNGKYIYVPVRFHSDRGDEGYYEYFHEAKRNGVALNYRFMFNENGKWYVHVSFTLQRHYLAFYKGVIGVDINYGLIATSEIDSHGNYVGMKNYEYNPEGMITEQKRDVLSLFVQDIVDRAEISGKAVSIEDLDLEGKKQSSFGLKKYNRKVNMLEYGIIRELLVSKCIKRGVYIRIINPAYTSVIGKYKYMKFYGIGIHNAAALVIARRLMRYKEIVPIQMTYVLHGGEESKWGTIRRHRHHWSHWSYLKQNLESCLKEFNSGNRGELNPAITVNMLMSRFNPDELSFASGYRKEYFSIKN